MSHLLDVLLLASLFFIIIIDGGLAGSTLQLGVIVISSCLVSSEGCKRYELCANFVSVHAC